MELCRLHRWCRLFSNGLGSGGGHGGKGGEGYYNGNYIGGGIAYGNANLPCELGSGSGNDSLPGATAGGGVIGALSNMVNYVYILSVFLYFVFLFRQESASASIYTTCHLLV